MQKKVRKAIIPVAGFGTRFLPATKAQPKEMLPLVDKPIIQYDLQMQELNRFEGATDAARKLKLGRTAIKNNLIGLSKTCNKTIFKYVPSY